MLGRNSKLGNTKMTKRKMLLYFVTFFPVFLVLSYLMIFQSWDICSYLLPAVIGSLILAAMLTAVMYMHEYNE